VKQGLQELGWVDGSTVHVDVRWAAGNPERMRMFAQDLISQQSEVIVAHGTPVTRALQRATQTIPIVFVTVSDPVGEGYVASLSRPGGNLTGFLFAEAEMGGKWLELLKEIAPDTKRAAIMSNPDTAPGRGTYYLRSFEAAARSLKVELVSTLVHGPDEIEAAMASLGREQGSGLTFGADPFMLVHRRLIISTAAQNHIPVVYYLVVFVTEVGLISYGPDIADVFRRAGSYVDRILRGEKPGELAVQVPVKFLMAINLKTAKALGLEVPWQLQQLADEVIE